MELGDDSTYKIEEVGSNSLQLDSGTVLHIDDILYIPGLKKSLLSVVGLEDKGYRVLFVDKKVLLWEKNEKLSSVVQIGVREGGLYKVFGNSTHMLWFTIQLIHVSCDIGGLDTSTIQLFHAYKRWLQVCQRFLQNMMEFAKVVL